MTAIVEELIALLGLNRRAKESEVAFHGRLARQAHRYRNLDSANENKFSEPAVAWIDDCMAAMNSGNKLPEPLVQVVSGEESELEKVEEEDMATAKKKSVKKTPAKKAPRRASAAGKEAKAEAKAEAKQATGSRRKVIPDNAVIRITAKGKANPKRVGSKAELKSKLMTDGMTVGEFKKKGREKYPDWGQSWPSSTIHWDVKHENIKLEMPKGG